MNKRDIVLSLLDADAALPYLPAAFFLHFPAGFHAGQAAVDKHLEFFRYTGMDLIKLQYERKFPPLPQIRKPEDWAAMPRYGRDFFAGQLQAVQGVVKAARREAVILQTLYSPFMCALHSTGSALLAEHLASAPERVRAGLEIITESLRLFVRECIKLGVDGFYMSTKGGEGSARFLDASVFEQNIKPFDLSLMEEIDRACPFNILHVCGHQFGYDSFAPLLDYPGQLVSCPLTVGGQSITPDQAAQLFGRPFMGGLERKGLLTQGTPEQVRAAIGAVRRASARPFILGAECTVADDTPWARLKLAVDAAHALAPF